jgi:peptidoglycan LD-endopeptidase CwlK
MKRKISAIILLFALVTLFSFCGKKEVIQSNTTNQTSKENQKENSKENLKEEPKSKTETNSKKIVRQFPLTIKKSDSTKIPIGARKLVEAYPDFLDSTDGKYIYWKDGTKMLYDDGRKKTFDEMLDDADLEDQMSQEYVMGDDFEKPPAENFDPGRIRNEEFFKKMYGGSSGEVQGTLTAVNWMPNSVGLKIQFTTVNNAHSALYYVGKELDNIASDMKKYVTKSAGSFYWRVIAGTNRLSMHSFGIAIDINTDYSDYWLWDKGKSGKINYKNRIPVEIAKIFEKYGFIWGAKWYHYDTMHFEYRPELLIKVE